MQGGKQACMHAGRHAGRQAGRKEGRQGGKQACMHAGRQAGRQAGSKAGSKAGRKANRKEGMIEGRHASRKEGRKPCREVSKHACREAGMKEGKKAGRKVYVRHSYSYGHRSLYFVLCSYGTRTRNYSSRARGSVRYDCTSTGTLQITLRNYTGTLATDTYLRYSYSTSRFDADHYCTYYVPSPLTRPFRYSYSYGDA